MVGVGTQKIILDDFGSFLSMQKGCITVKSKEGDIQKFPLFESQISEIVVKSGNALSSGVLASCGFWGIDVLIMTQRGNPVAMLKSLDDDGHVEQRISQYKALENGKGLDIAKQIVLSKVLGENLVLQKYGLRQHDFIAVKRKVESIDTSDLRVLRRRLLPIEGTCTDRYFSQILPLFSCSIQKTDKRRTHRAYDALNNSLNLVYTLLKWKCHIALINGRLEPFLGYLHCSEAGKPSLACDMMELYRHLADDFLIQYSRNVQKGDFVVKDEKYVSGKIGKREYLSDFRTNDLMRRFYAYLELKVDIPRVRHGNKCSIETLINEEALLLGMYLRSERKEWIPRVGII